MIGTQRGARLTPRLARLDDTLPLRVLHCVTCLREGVSVPRALNGERMEDAIEQARALGWMLGTDGWHCPGHHPERLLVTGRQDGEGVRVQAFALDSMGQVMQPCWHVYPSLAAFQHDIWHLGYAQVERIGYPGAFRVMGGCSGVYRLQRKRVTTP